MYYSIYQIQAKIANIASFKEKKVEIIQFFNINNLIENVGVDTIYTSDNHPPFLLHENDLKKIYQVAQEKFNLEFKVSDFYEGQRALLTLDKEEGITAHKVTTKKDIELVAQNHAEQSSYGKKEQLKDYLDMTVLRVDQEWNITIG